MWAEEPGERSRRLCALVAIAVLTSIVVMVHPFSDDGAAILPVFTRPNVQVDSGPGWVGTSSPGGPVIATGVGGVLHAAWSDNSSAATEWGIYYAQSINGGLTWTPQKRIDGFVGSSNYAPFIAVDTTSGPYAGYIYVAWQRGLASQGDVFIIRSTDGGATWLATDKHQVDKAPPGVGSFFARVAVDPGGRVYVAFDDMRNGNRDIFVVWSDDGGFTWPVLEVQVTTSVNNDAYAWLAFYTGTVYLAWQETSAASITLWLGISADQGSTWSSKTIYSVAAGSGGARSLSIAVGQTGTIHAAWILDDATSFSMAAYSHSTDQGTTWSAIAKVNDVPSAASYVMFSVTIVESSNILYVVWLDNRNGDSDIFASWSEDDGATWGDGLVNNNDIRVDDTDANGNPADDATMQYSPYAVAGLYGVYVIWSDGRSLTSMHAYFASFEASEMMITEVRDSPAGMEEVEIYNHGGKTIDLAGWDLVVDGVRVDLDPLGSIPSGAYYMIGDPPTANLVVDIALNDEGGSVLILDQFGSSKDYMSYGQLGQPPDPVTSESVARVPAGAGYSTYWARAQIPTFGAANGGRLPVASPSFVLNEVYFNAANPADRFVELFFKDVGSLNIAGHILVVDDSYVLPSVLLSDSNPFYVIRPSQAPSLFSLMDVDRDNLYLYNPGGAFMDEVGWSAPHSQGMSMVRVPDGFGTSDGYNDLTSAMAGWQFDEVPSLPLVIIGPKQSRSGDLGARITYTLWVTNKEPSDEYVNIEVLPGTMGWTMNLFRADGVTPLVDSPGDPDNIPDVGLMAPEVPVSIKTTVDIPPFPQSQDFEVSQVKATIASDPLASATVVLTTSIYPYEAPDASVNPTTIWVDTSPPSYQPKQTQVTLTVEGRGVALLEPRPQDTVFMIDSSGSMGGPGGNDPTNLRLAAAKHYVDLLTVPDRAAVVDFDSDAFLVGGDHLSSNYALIKSNIDTIDSFGATNLLDPIRIATDELIAYGDVSHIWVEILLTDGDDTTGHSDAQILAEAQRAANNGIVIFTIGLIGGGGVNEGLLQQIASVTGGIYMRAQSANDLDAIYQLIGSIVKNLAGYDRDVRDDIPMISVFLPVHITYIGGSANPAPDYIGQGGGKLNLQWNLSKLSIGETWGATLRVTSSLSGSSVPVLSYPDSRVTYIRYDDTQTTIPFPETFVEVLSPPPPPPQPVNYTVTRFPLGNVTIDGTNFTAPARFQWLPGEIHSISVLDIEVVAPGERWVFDFWDDGGSRTHDITVGTSDKVFTAFFFQQFMPMIDLQGIDGAHAVSAHFTSMKQAVDQPGAHGAWSEWIDSGTALSFDAYGANSNTQERWITLENFGVAPWIPVTSAFSRVVVYWHQVYPSVVLQSLPPSRTVPISFTEFGGFRSASSYSIWTNWVDFGTTLRVGGRLEMPTERYINTISKGSNYLEWIVTSPDTFTIPFLHQFRPTVHLIGTDSEHTVDVLYRDSTRHTPVQFVPDLNLSWSEWADDGTTVTFSNHTTGNPPYTAINETAFVVNSAFVGSIVYVPPPLIAPEPNYKPLISIAFVILLLALGLFLGNRKPWDRFIPPPRGKMKPEEIAAREKELKKKPMAEKLKLLSPAEAEEKFVHDRRWTMSMLAVPFAAVEGLIGVASLATGILRVPETGNWFSLGLIVNSMLLAAGMGYDLVMQRRGYKVPKESELAAMTSKAKPAAGKVRKESSTASASRSSPKAPEASPSKEQPKK